MLMTMISRPASQNCGVPNSMLAMLRNSERTPLRKTGRLLQDRLQQRSHLRGIARDLDARCLHHVQLLVGGALAARDDRARVAHALARWRRDTGNESDYGLAHVVLDPLRSRFFIRAADLANHHDGVGARVVVEKLQHVDVLETIDRIATDAYRRRLTEAELGQLPDRFVRQRARA